MEAKELRIGNWVVIAHESNAPLAIIETIEQDQCFVRFGNNELKPYTFDFLLPIHLTEEWKKRFRITTRYLAGVKPLWLAGEERTYIIDIDKIEFVHEFQNIYKLFTGKERKLESNARDNQNNIGEPPMDERSPKD